jgi:cysteine desulfurase
MLPFMTSSFGNPHSSSHEYGWETEDAVSHARKQIADLIKADEKEIVFTSGATESNNQALKVNQKELLGLGWVLWNS